MSWGQETDVILDGVRAIIGTAVIVGTSSLAIRQTPETDLLNMPAVTSANYPLVALDVVDDSPGVAPDRESAKTQSVGVTVAMHTVIRYADVDAHPTVKHPNELARKASEAVNALIAAAPDLSLDIVGRGIWRGGGQDIATREELHAQGLCTYTGVWQFDYGVDRT